jgi:hypothetical protein
VGSQNVTDFTAARKKRIRDRIREFDPRSPLVAEQAWSAAAAAIGTFAKTSPFMQCMASASTEKAYEMLYALWEDFRRSRELKDVLEKYGVLPESRRPYGGLEANVRRKFREELTKTSLTTDSAPAAEDAISKTISTIVSGSLRQRRTPTDASLREIAKAFRRTSAAVVATLFVGNLLSSLTRLSFDAARGREPPAKVEQLAKKVDEGLAATVGKEIVKSAAEQRVKPRKILSYIRKPRARDRIQVSVESGPAPDYGPGGKTKGPVPIPDYGPGGKKKGPLPLPTGAPQTSQEGAISKARP